MTGYMHRVECDHSEACRCACICHQRCGAILGIIREPCFRLKGHRYDHRSREYVERQRVTA